LPYRHTVPLWEMESDYYLHNFHVTSGRGTWCSMGCYQRAFGITWNDNSMNDAEDAAMTSPINKKINGSALVKPHKSRRANSYESSVIGRSNEESKKVQRVRNRCEAQKAALSTWWKHALQAHIQQRMWMQLGRSQAEVSLPPRFERIYQPENLGQFDRYFSRAWSTPVRRSHSAQHIEGGVEDGEASGLSRVISTLAPPKPPVEDSIPFPKQENFKATLTDFFGKYGYEPWSETSLRRFTDYHSKLTGVIPEVAYIGNPGKVASIRREQYERYVSSTVDVSESPQRYRSERIDEFKECLKDYTLHVDDVSGIQKVCECKSAQLSCTVDLLLFHYVFSLQNNLTLAEPSNRAFTKVFPKKILPLKLRQLFKNNSTRLRV